MKDKYLIASYVLAGAVANLVVAAFGQKALIFTALVLIPFDLVARDILHDRWKENIWLRMSLLILGGSALSFIINTGSIRIAAASFFSFLVSGIVDAVIYQALIERSRLVRINGSNAASSITDSLVFPFVAFDSVSLALCATQALIKFSGGIVWSLLLTRRRSNVYHPEAV